MQKKLRSQIGFTIIELMITLVIIGIVAGMAVPRFQSAYERLQFKDGVRELTSKLKLARSMAIAQKTSYGVHFNNTTKAVTLFQDIINPAAFDLSTGDSVIVVDTLPREFSYLWADVANAAIIFRSNGSAGFVGTGAVHALSLTNDIIGIVQIDVLASTGRVSSMSWVY